MPISRGRAGRGRAGQGEVEQDTEHIKSLCAVRIAGCQQKGSIPQAT